MSFVIIFILSNRFILVRLLVALVVMSGAHPGNPGRRTLDAPIREHSHTRGSSPHHLSTCFYEAEETRRNRTRTPGKHAQSPYSSNRRPWSCDTATRCTTIQAAQLSFISLKIIQGVSANLVIFILQIQIYICYLNQSITCKSKECCFYWLCSLCVL